MRRLVVVLWLVLSNIAFSIDIPKECVVPNCDPGCCAWASIETLGNYHKIEQLKGLRTSRLEPKTERWLLSDKKIYDLVRAYGYPFMIKETLEQKTVSFKMQDRDNKSLELLKDVDKVGAVVAWKPTRAKDEKPKQGEYSVGEYHAVVLTKFGDKEFSFCDTNYPAGTVFTGKRDWFDKYWTGEVIKLEP